MVQQTEAIEALFGENRTFPPPADFRAHALVKDDSMYKQAEADFAAFWAEQAKTLDWYEPWQQVLDWQLPYAKWFVGICRITLRLYR